MTNKKIRIIFCIIYQWYRIWIIKFITRSSPLVAVVYYTEMVQILVYYTKVYILVYYTNLYTCGGIIYEAYIIPVWSSIAVYYTNLV
jgi:hypothetical protein